MAYQTGTASSWINLLDALRLFATANGWTQNLWTSVGADQRLHLQKGSIYANFLAEADDTDLFINGSLGFDGGAAWNAQPSRTERSPRMRDGVHGAITWPVTYHFFLHTSPDAIEVVVRYQPTRYQWMAFGAITKYGAWTGGEYYCATNEHPTDGLGSDDMSAQDPGGTNIPALFWKQSQQFSVEAYNNFIHCEIDSRTWGTPAPDSSNRTAWQNIGLEVSASNHVYPLPARSVSAFNGLATLQPIWLFARRPDGLYSPLGRVEHARYMDVKNHNPGDIITIGGARWMVFPWLEKGGPKDAGGVHYGWAIAYDGP